MNTIHSKIIWDELGLKDYKIHLEDKDKTQQLILDWIRDNTLEKVEEVLFDLSWIDRITNDGYYDGPFYGLNQHDKDKQYLSDDGTPQSDILVHDVGLKPTIIHIAIKTRMSPEEFIFISKILEVYYQKLPKQTSCPLNMNEGDEY